MFHGLSGQMQVVAKIEQKGFEFIASHEYRMFTVMIGYEGLDPFLIGVFNRSRVTMFETFEMYLIG